MRTLFAAAILVTGSLASAAAADVSGTVYGTIGTGGVTGVGGSVTVGTGGQPDDDPAPPMGVPATPGTAGANGTGTDRPPVMPDVTSDAPPPTGNDPGHN